MTTPDALYEVEVKFRVREPEDLRRRLDDLGATWGEPVRQSDQYFAHPSRNFRETDEALHIRSVGDEAVLTYKGPVIDRLTKTRREIEVPIDKGTRSAGDLEEILISLGFRPVREVAKVRRAGQLVWQGRTVEWAWDAAAPLGDFIELEIVTSDADRPAAREVILSLAAHLGLTDAEPRSYLQLLLDHDFSADS